MSAAHPYCERLRSRFDDYHDGRLSSLLQNVVHGHLDRCSSCRADYERLARTIEMIRTRPAPDVKPRVLREVVENLSRPRGGATLRRDLFGPELAAGLETP